MRKVEPNLGEVKRVDLIPKEELGTEWTESFTRGQEVELLGARWKIINCRKGRLLLEILDSSEPVDEVIIQ